MREERRNGARLSELGRERERRGETSKSDRMGGEKE